MESNMESEKRKEYPIPELGVELELEDQKITTFQELADFIDSKLN